MDSSEGNEAGSPGLSAATDRPAPASATGQTAANTETNIDANPQAFLAGISLGPFHRFCNIKPVFSRPIDALSITITRGTESDNQAACVQTTKNPAMGTEKKPHRPVQLPL